MRLRLRHEIAYRFASPVRGLVHQYRLHPRNFEGQYVEDWQFDVNPDCRLLFSEDCHGNFVQGFSLQGPCDAVTVNVDSRIETYDTAGSARGAVERFPVAFFLRGTPLTQVSDELRAFAGDACPGAGEPLARLHALLPAVCNAFAWTRKLAEREAGESPRASDVLAAKSGDARDLAHVFIACARSQDIPARFVSGYCLPGEGDNDPLDPAHCWAEGWVEGLGWIGFDPAIGVCPGEKHVRMAIGLDWLSAAPARLSHAGLPGMTVENRVEMRPDEPKSSRDPG